MSRIAELSAYANILMNDMTSCDCKNSDADDAH